MKTGPNTPTQNNEKTISRKEDHTPTTIHPNTSKAAKQSPPSVHKEKDAINYYPTAKSNKHALNKRIKSVNIATDDPEYVAQFFKLMRKRFEENKKQREEHPYYPPCYFEPWDE